jgi:hypothetical protein
VTTSRERVLSASLISSADIPAGYDTRERERREKREERERSRKCER